MDLDDPILGFTTSWIRAMAKRVEFIHVITMREGRIEVPQNVRVYSVGKEKGYSEPRRVLELYRHLFHILRQDRIDACFSHMIAIFTVLAAPVLKLKGIPIVTWYAHLHASRTLKLAHYLSDSMVSSLVTAYPYKPEKLTVIGQGTDIDLFAPDGTLPEEPPMILCVGRLSPVKNHLPLLKAMVLLRERWKKPFALAIVGGPATPQDESYVQSLHDQVRALELQDFVRFEGPMPMASLPSWYRRCTLHVNMTATGSGDKVCWEGMSCGRPCLLANEGFRETLGGYAGQLLFRHGDAESIAERCLWLLELPVENRNEIGNFLRAQVVRLHSLNHLVDQLQKIFETESAKLSRT